MVMLKGKTVLIADDNERNIFALSAILRAKGMRIISAENGEMAIEKIKEFSEIDIVLMDMMMPVMDGYEAMKYIRTVLKKEKLPIIALTAKAMKGDREKCLEAGATEYCPKPVDFGNLKEIMLLYLDHPEE